MSTPRSLDLPAGVEARRVVVAGTRFASLQARPARAGAPTALLVPGWTGSKEDFLAILAPLATAGWHVVAIDQRGQFETPGTGEARSYSLSSFARDTVRVVEALGAGPVHLVGHSYGGLVAQAAAALAPGAVRSLVLMSTGPGPVPDDRHPLLHAVAESISTNGLRFTWVVKRAYDRSQGAPDAPAAVEAFLERRFMSHDPYSLRAMTLHLTSAAEQVHRLAATTVPVLVVTGEDDYGWPVAEQAQLARRLRAPHVVVRASAHSPAVEQPDAVVDALTAFWAEVEGPARAVGG